MFNCLLQTVLQLLPNLGIVQLSAKNSEEWTLLTCIVSDSIRRTFQARSQNICKGGTRRWRDRRSRARRGGAKRRSAEGVVSGEGRRSPSPVWGLGAMPPENFRKINVEIAHFRLVLATSGVWHQLQSGHLSVIQGLIFFNPWRGGDIHPCPPSGYAPGTFYLRTWQKAVRVRYS